MTSYIPVYSPHITRSNSGLLIEFKWHDLDFTVEKLRLILIPSQQEYFLQPNTSIFKIYVGLEPVPWKAHVQFLLEGIWSPLCEFHPVKIGPFSGPYL